MGAKVSAEMIRAKGMILDHGATAYAAAKACGITAGAITRTAWYQKHLAAQTDPMAATHARAKAMVVEQGMTAYAAAKTLGVAQSTITRSAWYKDHKNTETKQNG